jgi:hypothetical protein
MKKTLVIAGLAVLSTSAFASKARMEALGQSNGGSHYIMDSRSVFLNPAELNGMKNYIVTEWGTGAYADTSAAPRAEGGFFRDAGSFAYGLYLGNNDSRFGAHSTIQAGMVDQTNAMDLFLAGDMGMKWGARLHYANSKNETTTTEKKHSSLGLGLGVTQGDMSAHLNIDLADKATGTGAAAQGGYESKLKPSFTLGGSYAWMGNTFFVDYTSNKLDSTTTTTTTYKYSDIAVGAARTMEVNPGARVFGDATLHIEKSENYTTSYATTATAGTTKYTRLPVTLGMEAEATSWLTVRGSISQNVILGTFTNAASKKITKTDSTNVAAGATLNFGKLKVDGTVGTLDGAGAAGEKGVLSTSNLLTRVGLTYNF